MKTKNTSPPNPKTEAEVPVLGKSPAAIVAIGASAGVLEAFEQFFRNTQVDSGFGYVLIPHLDPSHASLLTKILQHTTAIPVLRLWTKYRWDLSAKNWA